MLRRRDLLSRTATAAAFGSTVAIAGCSGDDGDTGSGTAVEGPDIQFGSEFTPGAEPDDFGGDTGGGCGVLNIYTAGGSESVGADRITINGSSQHSDGLLWGYSGMYNVEDDLSPSERADSTTIRVSDGDQITLQWVTENNETVPLQTFDPVNC